MKAAALIAFALFIDGMQAALSAALAVVAALPGTIAGGAAGCIVGNYVLGNLGCAILGAVGGFLGSLLDAAAVITEPVGIIMGFVVTICISATFGAALIGLLIFSGMFKLGNMKYVYGASIAELLPGLSILPSWTAMTVLCVLQKSKEEGGVLGAAASVATAAASPSPGNAAQAARAVDGIRAAEPQTNAA